MTTPEEQLDWRLRVGRWLNAHGPHWLAEIWWTWRARWVARKIREDLRKKGFNPEDRIGE